MTANITLFSLQYHQNRWR